MDMHMLMRWLPNDKMNIHIQDKFIKDKALHDKLSQYLFVVDVTTEGCNKPASW